jgi:SAM-dependent methyltransferase
MEALLARSSPPAPYEGLAAHYDAFTAGHEYERWLDALERLAAEHGLRGRRLLDVGCGTGKSFMPMLRRGYAVVACDISEAMVERARAKAGGRAEVLVADMRKLPPIGEFDLVTCLDDAVNYLTSADQLRAAFEGFARNLRPGGVAVFDANTLATFRGAYANTSALDSEGAFFCLRGEGEPDLAPGGVAEVWIEVFSPAGEDLWRRDRTRHLHRHHPREEIERALAAAGLELVAARGQSSGVRISREPDEELHAKTVYVARRAA